MIFFIKRILCVLAALHLCAAAFAEDPIPQDVEYVKIRITLQQFEALQTAYGELKTRVKDLSDYHVTISDAEDYLIVSFYWMPLGGEIRRGSPSTHPEVRYQIDKATNKIVRIFYGR